MSVTLNKKIYQRQYRKKNRERLNLYRKEYLERSGRKYSTKANGKTYFRKGNIITDYKLLDMSGKGRYYEKLALKLLQGSTDSNIYGFTKNSWDIVWKRKKIDVKMINESLEVNRNHPRWQFIVSNKDEVDSFLFFLCKKDILIWIFLIPSKDIKCKTISFSPSTISKYKKYIVETSISL